MNLSKVKLVVSDMGRTLLNSKGEVSNHFFELFKKLQKHKIYFVAASEKQYILNPFRFLKNTNLHR